MIKLNDKQAAEFCHRSYTAVDGLWFIKVEEKHGFDAALEIDNEVCKVKSAKALNFAFYNSVINVYEK